MSVVTIRGQLGSGAPEIGKLIARKLHFDYVDREVLADVAERLKRPKEEVENKEMPPGTLLGRIAEALGRGYALTGGGMSPGVYLPAWEIPLDDTRYLEELESVIKKLASSQSIVIRGRGSQFILKDYPGAVHVLLVAPIEFRIKRVEGDLRLDTNSARKEVERFDGSRREFTKRYFGGDLEDPANYHVVINTQLVGLHDAASIVTDVLLRKRKSSSKRQGSQK